MLCKGFALPNFNPKKDNFFVMLHFTCTCTKSFTKSIQIIKTKHCILPLSMKVFIFFKSSIKGR